MRSETEKEKGPIQGKAFSCLLASGTVRFIKCISGLCDQEKGGKNQQSLPFGQELPHYSLFHTSRLHIHKSQSCYYGHSMTWHQKRPAAERGLWLRPEVRLRHTDRLHWYMLRTVFTSHSFMDAYRRYETPRSETKDFITQAT